jgi:hypothetical protein
LEQCLAGRLELRERSGVLKISLLTTIIYGAYNRAARPTLTKTEMADNGQIERATPLKPTIWMTGVLVWATAIGLFLRIPTWAGIFLCTLTGLSFLLYTAK